MIGQVEKVAGGDGGKMEVIRIDSGGHFCLGEAGGRDVRQEEN